MNTDEQKTKNIEAIIDEEIAKSKEYLTSIYSSEQSLDISKTIEKIVERFTYEFDKDVSDIPEEILETLINLPIRLSFDELTTYQIFERLEIIFENKLDNCLRENTDSSDVTNYSETVSGIGSIARSFYSKQICSHLGELAYPERITFINRAVGELGAEKNKYKYKVLLELKELYDQEIEFLKQEASNRKLIQNVKTNSEENLQMQEIQSNDFEPNKATSEDKNKFTMRRKVLTLMMLTFDKLEIPEGLVNERIVEFFHNFTGGDLSELRRLVARPTAHKENNKLSIKYLCEDLKFAQHELEKLELWEKVRCAKTEINSLIMDLEEEKNEMEEEKQKKIKKSLV